MKKFLLLFVFVGYTETMVRRTLKRQIVILTGMVMVMVSALVFLLAYWQYRSYSDASQKAGAEYNLSIIATLVDGELRSVRELSRWIQYDSTIDAWLAKPDDTIRLLEAHEVLVNEFIRNPSSRYISRLAIVDAQKRTLLQTGADVSVSRPLTVYTIGMLFPMEDYGRFQGVITDPLLPASSPQMIPLCIPLSSWNDSSVRGYLCVEISTRILSDKFLAPDARLAFSIGENTWKWEGGHFVPYVPSDGMKGVVSLPLEEDGLFLLQRLPSFPLPVARGFLLLFLCVLCALLAIGAMLAWWLNKMVGIPVIRIRGRIARIAGGDFSADPSIVYDSELGDIGRGVNEMAKKIDALIKWRIQDEADRKDLEYRMLQSQINPHFLNNTLHSIKCMADLKHADGISQMVTALARLFEHVSKGSTSWCTIGEELSLLDDYFVIQSYRYGGSIEMQRNVPLEYMDVLIPRFTFQPVVENAIFHGIEPNGTGNITIGVRDRGEDVVFVIQDDGVGMSREQVRKLLSLPQENRSGMFKSIGMYNVHQRIVRMFGPEYGLRVESESGKGTIVEVLLPRRGRVDGNL